jgi:hypothetical protein|tara:strand:+ start:2636 stop:2794 length:159 start_codon:yes stop_codon:yes gene_type:complete
MCWQNPTHPFDKLRQYVFLKLTIWIEQTTKCIYHAIKARITPASINTEQAIN